MSEVNDSDGCSEVQLEPASTNPPGTISEGIKMATAAMERIRLHLQPNFSEERKNP